MEDIKLGEGLTLGKGWFDLERDDLRPFRWNTDISHVNLNGAEGKALVVYAGTGNPDRRILAKIDNQVIGDLKLREGWHYYYFPFQPGQTASFFIDTFIPGSTDKRDLGCQVAEIFLIDKELSPNASIFTGRKMRDALGLKNPVDLTFQVTLKSRWVDFVYAFYEHPKQDAIFSTEGWSQSTKVFSGGERMVCLEFPQSLVGKTFNLQLQIPDGRMDVFRIVPRSDFYDFLGLLSGPLYDAQARAFEEQAVVVSRNRVPFTLQWFVTWKCNYQCEYCWQEASKEVYRFEKANKSSPEAWAEKFNAFNPDYLAFTGGEPTLYPYLPELVSLLNGRTNLVITSNFGKSFNLDKWIQHVPRGRFQSTTFSFHPSQVSYEEFIAKLERYIAHYGTHRLQIEMVLYPKHLSISEKLIEYCKKRDIMLALDPYVPAKPEMRTAEEISAIRSVVKQNTQSSGNINYDSPQYWETSAKKEADPGRQPIWCHAGTKRLNIDGEGNAFTCMSAIDRGKIFAPDALPHYKPIGNIFDPEFKLLKRPILCWESYRCSGCDFQNLDKGWTVFNKATPKLPIPE